MASTSSQSQPISPVALKRKNNNNNKNKKIKSPVDPIKHIIKKYVILPMIDEQGLLLTPQNHKSCTILGSHHVHIFSHNVKRGHLKCKYGHHVKHCTFQSVTYNN